MTAVERKTERNMTGLAKIIISRELFYIYTGILTQLRNTHCRVLTFSFFAQFQECFVQPASERVAQTQSRHVSLLHISPLFEIEVEDEISVVADKESPASRRTIDISSISPKIRGRVSTSVYIYVGFEPI